MTECFMKGTLVKTKRTDDAQSAPEFKLNERTMQYYKWRKYSYIKCIVQKCTGLLGHKSLLDHPNNDE